MESSRSHCRRYHLFFHLAILTFLSSRLPQTLSQLLPALVHEGAHDEDRDRPQVYIVYVIPPEHRVLSSPADREAWHKSFLPSPILDSGKPRLVYSYRNAISGFAAWLTPKEVEDMQEMEGFVDAQPDVPLELQTTDTPKFLGLVNGTGLWKDTAWGAGMLIGVLDSGIDPDHISFSGAGMRPFPRSWTGTCDSNCNYPMICTCTQKLLGARTFNKSGQPMPPDFRSGHGTLVASIAAGDFVSGVAYKKYARGTASGVAPGSYISLYRGAYVSDEIAAIEQAIDDGVDILSISQIIRNSSNYHQNQYAISTLAAVEKGIFVSMGAGNDGPSPRSMFNDAPWILTVGGCTHDRALEATLVLSVSGQQKRFYGVTRSQIDITSTDPLLFPRRVVYPGRRKGATPAAVACDTTVDGSNVIGAIVLCWRRPTVSPFVQADTVKKFGGIAMVLMNDQATGQAFQVEPYLPVFTLGMRYTDAVKIVGHVNTSQNPLQAYFSASNSKLRVDPYPVMYKKSSRGPGGGNDGILKPDILGPGVNIVGAQAKQRNGFTVNSGTSLATPHLSGVAALLKSRHPDWSPAAIRSAIMTTADATDSVGRPITDHDGKRADFYATGAGLVNPQSADDPGLIYNISDTADYLRVLCGLGYTQRQMNKFAKQGRIIDCSVLRGIRPEQLNYPSITAVMRNNINMKSIDRRLTNVGPAMSDYQSMVVGMPRQLDVKVTPNVLNFAMKGEEMPFTVTVRVVAWVPSGKVFDGYLKWVSQLSKHVVTSPLSVVF